MSDNILEGATLALSDKTSENDGIYHHQASSGHIDMLVFQLAGQTALAANQTYHLGVSAKGASADADSLYMLIGYSDAAGNRNWVGTSYFNVGTSWQRFEGTVVVPSGMTPFAAYVTVNNDAPELWLSNPSCNLGPYGATLASACHTPYVTDEHAAAVYATQASLTVQADRITSEVSARQQTDANLSELSTKVTQTETSITTEISDRKQAVSAAQTAAVDSANSATDSKLSSYTKTADLANTTAVKDAKKAGTDAAATANATATMIRQYSGGVLVCKTGNAVGALVNADGSFQVVKVTWSGSTPTVGEAISNMDDDSVDLAIGQASSAITMCGGHGRMRYFDSSGQLAIQGSKGAVLSYDPGTGVFPDVGIGVTADSAGNYRIYGAGNFDLYGTETVNGNLSVTGGITEGGRPVLTPYCLWSATSPQYTGTVNLSDNVSNYKAVSLHYRDSDGYDGTAFVGDFATVGSAYHAKAFCTTAGLTDSAAYVKCKTYYVQSVTVETYESSSVYQTCQFSVTSSNSCNYENADYIGLVGVYGWK